MNPERDVHSMKALPSVKLDCAKPKGLRWLFLDWSLEGV